MMSALKQARAAAGLSGRELSITLKRSANFAHLVESGERTLSVCEFIEYARACDADPIALFRDIAGK